MTLPLLLVLGLSVSPDPPQAGVPLQVQVPLGVGRAIDSATVRVARRAALEQEENRVRFAVLGWMPTLVLLLGFVRHVRRTRQERQAKRGR